MVGRGRLLRVSVEMAGLKWPDSFDRKRAAVAKTETLAHKPARLPQSSRGLARICCSGETQTPRRIDRPDRASPAAAGSPGRPKIIIFSREESSFSIEESSLMYENARQTPSCRSASLLEIVDFEFKDDEFCIKNDELCIKNEEICVKTGQTEPKTDPYELHTENDEFQPTEPVACFR